MRTVVIWSTRGLLVLALAAAAADLNLPARSEARTRVHLIDRSGSALVPGDPLSFTPEDAARVAAWDRERAREDDTLHIASFGRTPAFESTVVDPGATDLDGAVEAALARDPDEIVLYWDGRGEAPRAPLLCRARRIPVHVFVTGPENVRDVRIDAVTAPASAAPGIPVDIEVTVVSTYATTATLVLGEERVPIALAAGVPAMAAFRRPAGRYRLELAEADACPENNGAWVEILPRTRQRRILALSPAPLAIPGFEVTTSPRFIPPQPFDAVVLDNLTLTPAAQRALADHAAKLGGGLLLLGGDNSFAAGGWQRTPIDAVSPLKAIPEGDLAIVFTLDRSGSMKEELAGVLSVIARARSLLADDDRVVVAAYNERVEFIRDLSELARLEATGSTLIAHALDESRRELEKIRAARKHVLLLSDGETKETDEALKAAAARLRDRDIGLTVVTTTGKPDLGTPFRIREWDALEGHIKGLLGSIRDTMRDDPGPVESRPGPVPVPAMAVSRMNVTSAGPGAQVVASAGGAPLVAFRQAGRGRVGAITLPRNGIPTSLLADAVRYVAGDGPGGASLSLEPPLVRARGADRPSIEAAWQALPKGDSGTLLLRQTGSDAWEGRLPRLIPGTLFVSMDGIRAAAAIPSFPEYRALGVVPRAVHALAEQTGGRILEVRADLDALPRPRRSEPRSGRPFFLVAALVLLFTEMALSTFWKA